VEDEKPQYYDQVEVSRAQNEQAYSEDGVDLTLIRWMLSMTPTERLHTLQQSLQSLMRLKSESTRLT
jgi:hypothetical protein